MTAPRHITRILVANRAEIACRIIATARTLGISTVAVYSDADKNAAHVAMADRAVHIGPAPAAESYLQGARIIRAALETGADAIHPGYGFLSENPDFVDAVHAAGLVFIGPPASAIRAMGLKDAAKAAMSAAGVPVVPGYHGASDDPARLAAEAAGIGYPVLIKARAGGGGKGMRRVDAPGDFADALAAAEREAAAAFGDPACLVEKYIQHPRHIEIQVFADAHGNAVHMFERDCSLQRRHQKVIEEAPAPGMTDAMRAAMGKAAVEAAEAIGYQGAGTVEFIADGSDGLSADRFWFMEMNTRLQVEHPVSEAITGLDFVALQILIAAGLPLPVTQEDLAITGHAFEARIYAEDPANDFLPATGRLHAFDGPSATAFRRGPVRVDSGVRTGDEVSTYYDPMIAKVIVHGPDRGAALARLSQALAETRIAGLKTNVGFLRRLSLHPGFAAGSVDTGLIARDLDDLLPPPAPPALATALAALAALDLPVTQPVGAGPWHDRVGFRAWGQARHTARLTWEGTACDVTVQITAADGFDVTIDDQSLTLRVAHDAAGHLRITAEGTQTAARIARHDRAITVFLDGDAFAFGLPDPLAGRAESGPAGDALAAPMPGLVKVVRTAAGDPVTAGDPLIVLEAMKMEHTLAAPRDGVVADIAVAEGDQVEAGAILATLEPPA